MSKLKMDVNTKKRLFIRFLKENDCIIEYFRNIKHNDNYFSCNYSKKDLTFDYLINNCNYNDLITRPFTFRKTNEGYDYWQKINKMWKEYTYDIK